MRCLCILEIKPLLVTSFTKIYSHSMGCFLFLFLAAPQHIELPGRESDLNHGCCLSRSGGNARSLTHFAGPGIKPASQSSQDTVDPVVLHRELHFFFFFLMVSFVVQKLLSPICFYFHYSRRWIKKDIVAIYVRDCSACFPLRVLYYLALCLGL